MITVIRQFHGGMRACAQSDDGARLNWFEVEQGLRQEYVLSPLLFNIVFAAGLDVVLQRFSEDTGAPEGTADVDGTGNGYGLRSSRGVRYVTRE